jgi:hypothetical protein
MTELHADNLSNRLGEYVAAFDRAKQSGDWAAAEKLWRLVFVAIDTVIRESRGSRMEADALACELAVYRPTRAEQPPAPSIDGYVYVFTAKTPWVCAAVERREKVLVPTLIGPGYLQDHYTSERDTVCKKKVTFPVHERFASGGWPRLRELCPECVKMLAERKLINVRGEAA